MKDPLYTRKLGLPVVGNDFWKNKLSFQSGISNENEVKLC